MIDIFVENIDGDVEIINSYEENISPCIDCRYCWENRGCSIKDDMQEIYNKIDKADNIIIASPVYFHTVSGPLKIIIDRCQVYWAGVLRGDKLDVGSKKGGILLCGGAPEFDKQFTAAEITLEGLLKDFGARCLGIVTASNTDDENVKDNADVITEIKELSKAFN